MTKYEVPSHLNSSDTSTAADFQEEDSSDLESRMARLVGLEEDSPSSEENSVTLGQPLPDPQEPQDVQTQQSLSSNPFAKLGVVGAATLSVVIVSGVFLMQLMSGSNKPSTPNRSSVIPAPPQSKAESRLEQLERENESLRAKLALTEQAKAVKDAQQQLRRVKPTPQVAAQPSPRVEPRVYPRYTPPTEVAQRPPAPVRIVERIVRVDRPVREVARTPQPRPLPVPSPLPIIPPPIPAPNPQPTVEFTPPPTPDPMQEWARLAKLGSYGQVSTPDKQSGNSTAIAQRPNTPIQRLEAPRPPIRIAQPSPEVSPPVSTSVARAKSSGKSTVVGSTAKATLVNGLYGTTTTIPNTRSNSGSSRSSSGSSDSNSGSNNNNQVVIVQLRESLKDGNGSDIIPKGAELQARIRAINDVGLVDLSVDKAIWEEKGKPVERSIPPGTLTVSGTGGKPPVAKQYTERGGGSSFGRDVMLFALGGVQKAGEVLNRPTRDCYERDSTRNNDTFLFCEDDNNENIAAAIADGGVRSIVPEITRRTQSAQTQRVQRTQRNNVWWLPAGEKMEIRVERAIQL